MSMPSSSDSITGKRVAAVLERLAETRALPHSITVDHGPEFEGQVLDAWAYQALVQLSFIRPGKPVENAYIESFNGRFRDECLNEQLAGRSDARGVRPNKLGTGKRGGIVNRGLQLQSVLERGAPQFRSTPPGLAGRRTRAGARRFYALGECFQGAFGPRLKATLTGAGGMDRLAPICGAPGLAVMTLMPTRCGGFSMARRLAPQIRGR